MKQLKQLRLDQNNLTGSIPSWFFLSRLNPATVYLYCNFFTGKAPLGYPIENVKGNCYSSGNLRDHGSECGDSQPCSTYARKSKKPFIAIGAALGALAAVVLGAVVIWKRKQRISTKALIQDEETGRFKSWKAPEGIEEFTLSKLSKATRGFSMDCEIGQGSFGKVYRGTLPDGRFVAIKQADIKGEHHREFFNEITLLSRLHHQNLVPLIGFAYDRKHKLLVYEYMENGNLHGWLVGEDRGRHLDWYQRLEIAIGVAQGLEYLHVFADPPVIHRDLKPGNILLDGSLVARISDFGISKGLPETDTHVSTAPAGTAGFLDPEYFVRRQLTTASDVYSFGVVLLVLITGQKAIDPKRLEELNLVEWVKDRLRDGGISNILDANLGGDCPEDAYRVLADMALECTVFDREKRPSIKDVLEVLTSVKKAVMPLHQSDSVTTSTWTDVSRSTWSNASRN